MTEAEPLLDLLDRRDEHAALVEPATGDTVSHAELHEVAERLAGMLAGAGVGHGDTVALMAPNGPEIVAAFLGVVAAGAAAAPLNPAYTASEFESYLRDLAPAAALFLDDAGQPARKVCERLGIRVCDLHAPTAAALSIADATARREDPVRDPNAVALLLHTSGTTSAPKGVPIRQRHLAASIRSIARTYGLGDGDRSYCAMPLFHVHGLVASALSALAAGGTVVLPRRFSAGRFWDEVGAQGATWFSAVPTIHRTLVARAAESPAGDRAASLRFARSCSSALPATLWERFESEFGVPLVEAYGMTEASHQMTSNPLPPGERRSGTVGEATGVEVAILDAAWAPLPPGEPGEVAVRGPSVVDGYTNAPDATAASFRDGWFRTGDRGRLSADGYLSLDGRIKELINRGGEKISPHEVEDALLSHPAVTEAVAFAIPDDKYGETVGAAVIARRLGDVEELISHCAERLASFKVPSSVHMLERIPTGPTGKVQRRAMAELLDR